MSAATFLPHLTPTLLGAAGGSGGGTVPQGPQEVNLTLVLIAAGLIGVGVYLLLERSLSRVLVGLVMMGNGVSVGFMVASGPSGEAPIVTDAEGVTYSDPLPQAMVLTAIVIMLATVSFVLAMAYRSWQLEGNDDVQDDTEDALIRRMAAQDVESDSYRAEDDETEDDSASDFTTEELAEAAEAEAAERERERAAKVLRDVARKEQAAREQEAKELAAKEKAVLERAQERAQERAPEPTDPSDPTDDSKEADR